MTTARHSLRRTVDRSPAAAAGGPLVALSVAISLVARSALGPELRLRWTVGPSYHLGPSVVPSWTVLVAFPAVVAATYVGLVALGAVLDRVDAEDRAVRVCYAAVAASVLAIVVFVQAGLVAANLLL